MDSPAPSDNSFHLIIFESLTQVTSRFTQAPWLPSKAMAVRGVTATSCQPAGTWPPPKPWQKKLGSYQGVLSDVAECATLPGNVKG